MLRRKKNSKTVVNLPKYYLIRAKGLLTTSMATQHSRVVVLVVLVDPEISVPFLRMYLAIFSALGVVASVFIAVQTSSMSWICRSKMPSVAVTRESKYRPRSNVWSVWVLVLKKILHL